MNINFELMEVKRMFDIDIIDGFVFGTCFCTGSDWNREGE